MKMSMEMSMEAPEFKVGDIVRLKGGVDEWTLLTVGTEWVNAKHGQMRGNVNFHISEFELVRRPKRKEKRTVEMWANIYPGPLYSLSDSRLVFSTKEAADKQNLKDRIACVRLTGEYEVEVE